MKKNLDKWGFFLLIFVVFAFLQKWFAYHFFYIEQFQLFTNTHFYFVESWSHPGGGLEYVSSFLMQFFIIPFVGSAVATLLTASVFLLVILLQRKFLANPKKRIDFYLIAMSIAASCLLLFLDFNYYLQGNLAFIACLLLLVLCSSIKNTPIKAGVAFAIIPVLYWFAGPISLLFAVSFFIVEIQRNIFERKHFYWVLLPAWGAIVAFGCARLAFSGSFRMSFLPDLYYQPHLIPNLSVYLPWTLLIFWLVTILLFQKSEPKLPRRIFFAVQIVVFYGVIWVGFRNVKDRRFYQIQKLDYFARNEQWDEIIHQQNEEQRYNYLIFNYVNLALAKKGLLLDQLFDTKQYGIQSLRVSSQNKRLIAPLLSDIDYCVGDIASSQQYAFEGNQTCRGAGSGRLLKQLVETAIIFNDFQVATKYLNILKHTWYYRSWALAKEAAISSSKSNAKIEFKKRCLPPGNSREFAKDFQEQLEQLVADNSRNETAFSYLQASYLLSKNLEKLSGLWSRFLIQNKGKAPMPDLCQQALLALHETEPDTWAAMGIEAKTISLYKNYKSFLQHHHTDNQLKTLMESHFGTTYWFYLQFNEFRLNGSI